MSALFSERVMGAFIAETSSGTVLGRIDCLRMMSEISPVRCHQGGAIKSDRRQPTRQHIRASEVVRECNAVYPIFVVCFKVM